MPGYAARWRSLPRPQLRMVLLLAAAVVLANINQPYPGIAPLQHIPTILLILAAPALLSRWPLSNRAVLAVVAFFLLHTLAGRYAYSNVPYDRWAMALTGHSVSDVFGMTRNNFDRLVHLTFGLCAVPLYAEISWRYTGARWRAALWNAFLFVGAVSALYEIFEWLLTIIVASDLANEYNGQQGDMWDAQKDMAIALFGSVLAMIWQWRAEPGR